MCFTFGLRHLKIQPKPSMSEIRNYLVANPIYILLFQIFRILIYLEKGGRKKREKEENDKRNEGRNGSVGSRATCDKERERAAN